MLLLGTEIVRPDIVASRRERCPERPTGTPIKIRPDWICEIVSERDATNDTIKKLRLTVMRWTDAGYTTVQTAERGETIRAEPFEAVEIVVGTLFGDDPPG